MILLLEDVAAVAALVGLLWLSRHALKASRKVRGRRHVPFASRPDGPSISDATVWQRSWRQRTGEPIEAAYDKQP